MDADGLIPAALESTLASLASEGRRVKLLYTVPNFHNPAGVTLSAERRPQVLEIARRYGVLVLEDNPYGLLGFEGDPMDAMRSLDDEGVIYTWVKLPDGLDAKDMLPRAVTARVAYVPGTAFYADGQGRDHMRLSFCYPTPSRIREGVRRLAGVVAGESELVDLFGTSGGNGR